MDLFPLHDLTDRILRCAVAVHKELGPGLPESSYQTALALEMNAQQISFVPHPVYAKQVLTYLKVTKLKVGLLLNFNVPSMSNGGIRRFVL